MLQFFNGRYLRYEFHALIDGRWQLVGVTDDERDSLKRNFDLHDLRDLEMQVRRRAEAILRQPGVTAIKVLRERLRTNGSGSGEEIFHRENPARPSPTPRFKDYSGLASVCVSIDDLLSRPSRRIIGTMLRPLLDQLSLSPLELLTLHGASKAVGRADDAINAMIMRVAQIQTKQFGGDIRQRASALGSLVEMVRVQIKKAEAAGESIEGISDFDRTLTKLRRDCAAETYNFFAYRKLCLMLQDVESLGAKLERTVEIAVGAITPDAQIIADGMLADLIDRPLTMQDMLGPQPDLQHALETLSQLTEGKLCKGSALLTTIGLLLQRAAIPQSRDVLYDWLIRTLASTAPLTHGDLGTEWKAIDSLASGSIPSLPADLQPAALNALGKRQERLQAASFALVEND